MLRYARNLTAGRRELPAKICSFGWRAWCRRRDPTMPARSHPDDSREPDALRALFRRCFLHARGVEPSDAEIETLLRAEGLARQRYPVATPTSSDPSPDVLSTDPDRTGAAGPTWLNE